MCAQIAFVGIQHGFYLKVLRFHVCVKLTTHDVVSEQIDDCRKVVIDMDISDQRVLGSVKSWLH